MMGLTHKQNACLEAIKRLSADHVPPSYRELQDELGVGSVGEIFRLLQQLRERGLITFAKGRARSVRVVDEFAGLSSRTTEHLRAMRDRIDEILKGRAQ